MELDLKVESYSGYKADERPLRFAFAGKQDTPRREIRQILDRWYGLGYQCFKVRADDGNIYILRHEEGVDRWRLDSFRRS